MPEDRLSTYRSKRDAARTPEPVPEGPLPTGGDDTFVVQEHHARALHWDFRLERGGVLVSWAVPKGLPDDPRRNHLAVHTEDHPLEYASFSGDIPAGEYGGGSVLLWDRGTYETLKWRDDEVQVVLHGARVQGRFTLFRTGGDQWMVHRMDAPPRPGWEPAPELVRPMLATAGPLPPAREEDRWAYEMKWDGVRAVVYVDGGRARVLTRNDREVGATYPEVAQMAEALGALTVVLDGELVAFHEGRPDFGHLQQRMHVQRPSRALVAAVPVSYLVFDVLWHEGRSLLAEPYAVRRSLLESLDLRGPRWDTPPVFLGAGSEALAASGAAGLEGVVAKRVDAPYAPGARSRAWVKVKHQRTQEVVVGGWKPGEGRRSGGIGSLLLGIPGPDGLEYVGHVGTGFSGAVLDDLLRRLRPHVRRTSPFHAELPAKDRRDAVWVTPRLVGEVVYGEWTRDGRLRHPVWRGLREDKAPGDVVREPL
ncbi:non-homologous end-joining DNA ligase [Vallicoccus soli]|uniref:DNA ligase (ATP) n=1 Tax=Vallicoccus soli TaxID=2339232 RepID=A0A3A3Z1P8_9ACTN|nr:non-homologous end-joining DNA ligase [Vallicoccus soli]RJK96457.1 DNA ligase [Vallicoccus soli]